MKKIHIFNESLPLLLCTFAILLHLPAPAVAEVYKWVDKDGRVHFGDRPKDKKILEKSERVDVRNNYVPGDPALSAKRRAAQKKYLERIDAERERDRKEQAEAAAKREAYNAKCEKARNRLSNFTKIHYDEKGQRVVDYFIENGKPVTTRRQQEIVTEIKAYIDQYCG